MNIQWNAEKYRDDFSFVHQYGEDVLNLIKSKPGALVVDLGCGNGALSSKLAESGYRVIGIDASDEMLKTAKNLHPELTFQRGDACSFQLKEKADVIFSNLQKSEDGLREWINMFVTANYYSATCRNFCKPRAKGSSTDFSYLVGIPNHRGCVLCSGICFLAENSKKM